MSTKNRAGVELNVIVTLILVIIVGNMCIDPPIIFHGYGHFGILTHPVKCFKDLYFGWGYNQNSFIFSLKGLQFYFNMIPVMYHKYGIIKTTFAYFTQFSPVWAFVPLKLLYDTCIEFMSSNNTDDTVDNNNMEGADNE